MDRRKYPFFLLCKFTPFGSTLGLLLHLQYYQRCEPIILKMWVKSKFVLWQPRYYNLLTVKNNKKLTFLKYFFFWELAGTVSLKKIFSNTILRSCAFGKFYIARFNYFSGRPNKVKERFWNIFDWLLCWWYWK